MPDLITATAAAGTKGGRGDDLGKNKKTRERGASLMGEREIKEKNNGSGESDAT